MVVRFLGNDKFVATSVEQVDGNYSVGLVNKTSGKNLRVLLPVNSHFADRAFFETQAGRVPLPANPLDFIRMSKSIIELLDFFTIWEEFDVPISLSAREAVRELIEDGTLPENSILKYFVTQQQRYFNANLWGLPRAISITNKRSKKRNAQLSKMLGEAVMLWKSLHATPSDDMKKLLERIELDDFDYSRYYVAGITHNPLITES